MISESLSYSNSILQAELAALSLQKLLALVPMSYFSNDCGHLPFFLGHPQLSSLALEGSSQQLEWLEAARSTKYLSALLTQRIDDSTLNRKATEFTYFVVARSGQRNIASMHLS